MSAAALAWLWLAGAPTGAAQVPRLPAVQVSATRNARRADEVPAAVTVVPMDDARLGGPGINLSERLAAVPGLVARERQNYAQDLQVSIRGFGARSTFGIRGIRVLQDGFPVTMPDGQGQVSNLDMGALARVEVLRGPFSALYGNASGGVLQAFTARGADAPGLRAGLAAGADGTWRASANARGLAGGTDYNVDALRFRTDGYRRHGRAGRDLFQAMLRWRLPDGGEAALLANALSSPLAEDPLGLTDAQWRSDPRQAAPAALQFDTRKALAHRMVGLDLRFAPRAAQDWRVLAYGGTRDVLQFLAVPAAAQANPLSGGGVVDLGGRFAGLEARWHWQGAWRGHPLDATAGVAADRQWQHRRGFENFAGPAFGVRGALRRDQRDVVGDVDAYAQLDWRPGTRLGVLVGARATRVRFRSDDAFVTATNPDDGGRRAFSAVSPVAGLDWRLAGAVSAFASYGHGFETPTFDELAYRADGSAGLNAALDPSRTRSVELGLRSRGDGAVRWQAAAFRARTDDELVVATNVGGRSAFQNAGRARRRGVEASIDAALGAHWTWQGALTLLDARFEDDFLTCAGSPCPAPTQAVAAGTRLPGLARTQAFIAARWQGGRDWTATTSVQGASALPVANGSPLRAPGYATVDLELGKRWAIARDGGPGASLSATLRLANALDRRYVGSVIVNEASGRYFEPAPGRTLLLVLEWRRRGD
jgi:iron complex outermembrane receptor protein